MGNSNNSTMANNNAINTGGANTVEFPMGSYEAMETRTNRRNISFLRRRAGNRLFYYRDFLGLAL